MFKPITHSEFNNYDQETVDLYQRRSSDPRTTAMLLKLQRRSRNHLPVVVDENNPIVKDLERQHSQ